MNFLKLLFLFIILTAISVGQNYKKVKIFLDEQRNIQTLVNAGIALDHFELNKDKSIIAFLSDDEYKLLASEGYLNEVLIDDWYKYYDNRQKISASDLQSQIDESKKQYGVTGFHLGSMGGYMTLAEAYAELDTLKKLFPSLITAKESIGITIEGRDVFMVKVSDNPNVDENEPEVLYTALHHAREPEGMMQMFYFIYYLLENYDSDPSIQYLVNNRELYFIPVVNPDGYEYNHQTNPNGGGMWRKNRRANAGGTYGVDLNRNYGPYEYWNAPNGGSSLNGSSETYRGTAPFSEPETQIIRYFLSERKIKNALNYHTYGNYLIFPYGAKSTETPDSLTYREFAQDMTRYNGYSPGTDMQTVGYSTRGNSDDYFYDGDTLINNGKIFAMTPEVGNSSDGFWPPQSRIYPLAQENIQPNLYYAWVAGEYVSLGNPNFSQAYFNAGDLVTFYPSIKNKGLSTAGNIQVQLTSLSSYAEINEGSLTIDSISARSVFNSVNPFSFKISPSTPLETIIKLVFTASSAGVVMSDDTVSIIVGQPELIFSDNAEQLNTSWTVSAVPSTPAWETTTSTFYSSPSCFTDSKNGDYENNALVTMTLTNPIDLSSFDNPRLSFWTKYDIEANWDYAQVEVSTNNGSSWIPLAGNYTNPGSGSFQPNGQPLYDGNQADWVREEISLSGYNSNQTKIRFKLVSDEYLQRDGWYIDDINVFVYKVVPVELISFTGNSEGSNVILSWETATELNNYGFEVEKSFTANPYNQDKKIDWRIVGFVSGAGNSSSLKSYSFVDKEVSQTKNLYRLKQIDFDGSYKYSNEIEVSTHPAKFSLEQNYPNPFNPTTKIKYSIPNFILSGQTDGKAGAKNLVTLKVYDILGNEVATLVNEEKPAGYYEVDFNAKNLTGGVYFYKLIAGQHSETRKMIFLK